MAMWQTRFVSSIQHYSVFPDHACQRYLHSIAVPTSHSGRTSSEYVCLHAFKIWTTWNMLNQTSRGFSLECIRKCFLRLDFNAVA